MELSQRLQAVVNLVTPGNVVADVGCDHAYASIYLIEKKICKKVVAMDVNKGPLDIAKGHIEEYAYSEYIETRLSDGVSALQVGEANTLICAGMGGRLTVDILEKGKDKICFMKELILQPQSEVWLVRRHLKNQGFLIVEENMVHEDGKYYFLMRGVIKTLQHEENQRNQRNDLKKLLGIESDHLEVLCNKYGLELLFTKNAVLHGYLMREEKKIKEILQGLHKESGSKKKRLRMEELKREWEDIHLILEFFS